jgi:hypothetical protein
LNEIDHMTKSCEALICCGGGGGFGPIQFNSTQFDPS